MNILQINSSARGAQSHSTRLADRIVEGFRAGHPGASLTLRDLHRTPHPALDEAALGAIFTTPAERTPEQSARVALDDALIAELKAADIVVLGVPMYNFGVPSQLKHWIDAVVRAGVTFRYTADGPQGLLKVKTAFVAMARGGRYRNTPADSQTPYLRTLLGFLGIADIRFIYAEGLSMGEDAASDALASAYRDIDLAVAVELPLAA